MNKAVIGLDFGTESARAVLVDATSGALLASAQRAYPDGVIDEKLPHSATPLPPAWALQNSDDWLSALTALVQTVSTQAGTDPSDIIGMGIDFTACTVLPVTATGAPLHTVKAFCERPHAWPKLWKHHAAQAQADRINETALARKQRWLARYGGKISAEWLLPKALQMLEEDPELYAATDHFVEGADWVVWQLSGVLARNACAAGYKATWHKGEGFPAADFLAALHPDFSGLYRDKVRGPVVPPGQLVGYLTPGWAKRLGLTTRTAVATPLIDAHAAVLGAGVTDAHTLVMMMGTSTCHLLMSERETLVEGISGVVEDGIVPGLFGYEAGQAGVGDLFAWFVKQALPPRYYEEARAQGVDLHRVLTQRARRQRPGQHGLLALDWWNGNRSTLVDANLSGLLLGATLETKPEDIYRALIESTAFGTRVIIEAFTQKGVAVEAVVAAGGLTENALLMQIYADVSGHVIRVANSPQASALGAAMLGATAAGKAAGGHDTLAQAATTMAPASEQRYHPIAAHQRVYETLFTEYKRLYTFFGRGQNDVMKVLRALKSQSQKEC